jgi:hypothetical protein
MAHAYDVAVVAAARDARLPDTAAPDATGLVDQRLERAPQGRRLVIAVGE